MSVASMPTSVARCLRSQVSPLPLQITTVEGTRNARPADMLVAVTEWLDDEEMEVWRAFIAVSMAVRADLDAELVAAHGLTEGDYGVLVNLSEAPERRMRMCDLATVLHLSAS